MILLPDDVQFHEDICLLIYRPCGMLNEQSVDKIVRIIENLESELHEPFNRFFDTSGHDEVEFSIRDSDFPLSSNVLLGSAAGEIGDSRDGLYDHALLPVTCDNHRRLADQGSNISRTGGSCTMARRFPAKARGQIVRNRR